MRVGQARKRDQNEAAIVQALRQVGALVEPLSGKGVADLIVHFRSHLWLMEIKSGTGRPTLAQFQRLQEGWPVITCRSVEDALRAVGATR